MPGWVLPTTPAMPGMSTRTATSTTTTPATAMLSPPASQDKSMGRGLRTLLLGREGFSYSVPVKESFIRIKNVIK